MRKCEPIKIIYFRWYDVLFGDRRIDMVVNFKTLAAYFTLALGITGGFTSCSNNASGSVESDGKDNTAAQTFMSTSSADSTAGYNAAVKTSAPKTADCGIAFTEDAAEATCGAADVCGTTVRITRPGVYSVSGKCSSGKIIVAPADSKEVTLILNGLELKSSAGSVIECNGGRKLTLHVNDGSKNILTDSGYTFGKDETEPDSAVYSKTDMVISGGGFLSVNGLFKDGIKCKDTLSINCGRLSVTAKEEGIVGRDCVVIQGGEYTINAGADGIKSTNTEDAALGYVTINGGEFDIASGNDGISAQTALNIKGGVFDIVSGGEEADAEIKADFGADTFDLDRFPSADIGETSDNSDNAPAGMKGLKAGTSIVIADGELNIKSADDSIHSDGSVAVNGGVLKLSSCDDGIHAGGLLSVNGGSINISKSYEGLEGENIEINGGTINVVSADDGINAAGGDSGGGLGSDGTENDHYIRITGGDITINAGGDGIDSNGTIAQSGGSLTVFGPTDQFNGALDYEKSYAVSGGTLIALGSRGMAQAPGTLSQPCLSIYAEVAENSAIEVRGEDGAVILGATTPKRCQSLIFTCEKLKQGSRYGIYANGTLLCEVTATDGIAGGGANAQGVFGGGGFHGGHGRYE